MDTIIGGRCCHIIKSENSKGIIIKPLGEFERLLLEAECDLIKERTDISFTLVAFEVTENDLLPESMDNTLSYLSDSLIPYCDQTFDYDHLILGGYSLGGLFALWAATKLDCIDGVFAGSPSLWMEGWPEYSEKHPTKAENVYMSLGDREECTKKQPFCKVGDRVRHQHELHLKWLGPDHCILEWNEGGHFKDVELRKAKGFAWCLNHFYKI